MFSLFVDNLREVVKDQKISMDSKPVKKDVVLANVTEEYDIRCVQ